MASTFTPKKISPILLEYKMLLETLDNNRATGVLSRHSVNIAQSFFIPLLFN